jgi:peptidoglycan/xylan/chitin deacetylase (PgdA/CDA1 family)
MRYVTFSFDDGFLASTMKTARIYESLGLRAEFNVTAAFAASGTSETAERLVGQGDFADFGLLNDLQERGHFIQPHGYNHTDMTKVGLAEAKDLVARCIDVFHHRLKGFEPTRAIFCFPYNRSNEAIERHVGSLFRAFRTGYDRVINPIPNKVTKMIFGDSWPRAEAWIDRSIAALLALDSRWLVYNAHGLDEEGWEPISSEYLRRTLKSLLQQSDLSVLPIASVLDEYRNG